MTTHVVLIIEDDPATAEAVYEKITTAGLRAVVAHSGEAGLQAYNNHKPDVVVLDLMLPDIDGIEICRHIRRNSGTPIIMLTARVEEVDRIVGLEIGADDYITKPFSTKELIARIRAVLRRTARSGDAPGKVYSAAGIVLDEGRREVQVDGESVHLTPTEYTILALLMRQSGQVMARETLTQALWGNDDLSSNLLEIHIGHLRRKIEVNPRRPKRLVTIRSFGYKIVEEPAPGS